MTHPRFQSAPAFIDHLIRCGFKRYGPIETVNDFQIHRLDLTSLKLNVGTLIPVVISNRISYLEVITGEQLSAMLADLDELMKFSLKNWPLLLIAEGKHTGINDQLLDDMNLLGIAIIDGPTMEAIIQAQNMDEKARLLCIALVHYLGRQALSPYISGRPAIGGRFFGRSFLLQRLIPSAGNFMVVGNRRIGKTSLLREIRERLNKQNVLTAYIYGATCGSTEDVVYKLVTELGRHRELGGLLSDPRQMKNLASFVHKIADTENRRIAVFIDEVDRILEFDQRHGFEVFDLLRETFEHQSCRIFLAGFRKLIELHRSLNFPGFNFTTPIELPLFDRDETFEMIIKPLERLSINVGNTELPEAIYRETSGHPELIQIYCAEIVRHVEKHGSIPSGADLLNNILNLTEYRQKVLGTFLSNTNAYEELSCYLLIADAEKTERPTDFEFGAGDVNRVFQTVGIKVGIHNVAGIITNLRISGIIKQVAGVPEKFQLTSPHLINYCIGLGLDFCIETALARIKEENPSLWSDPPEATTL